VPALKGHGIRVIGLGVGTPQGGLVPDPAGGVLKDASGNAVLSKLEPATLQQLAEQTGGTYRDAATWVDIADLVGATVAKGHAGNYVEERRVRLEDRFQWFLAPALLLFLLSYWLELPLSPLARAFSTRGRRPLRASAPVIAAALVGLAAWQPPRQALAVATDAPPPQSVATVSQPPDLSATIAELSAKPSLDVPDYVRLANDTIGFAAQPASPRGGQRDGIIDDALAAVDRGERSDAHAADWPTLRQKLEALRKPPEQPQSKQDQQQKQDQKNQQGQGQDQKDQQQQSGGGQSQQDQQQQQAGGGQQQQDQQQQNAKDQQAQGGDAPKDQQDHESAQKSGGDPGNDKSDEQAKVDEQKDGSDKPQPSQDAKNDAGTDGKDSQQARGEQERKPDAKPVDAAGLGDDEQKPKEEPKAQEQAKAEAHDAPAPPPSTRMVGGGQVMANAPRSDDPETADALARMEHVKDGDAPAVLFDRMNRAEGKPQPKSNGKNW
jgi:Ca-activated chloride channel homolog